MNKKVMYFGLIVLLILGGGILFFSGDKGQQDNPTSEQATAESTDQKTDDSDPATLGESVSTDGSSKTVVYFFWGDGCPHCAVQKPFLEEMEQKYPDLDVEMYETWKNKDNAQLFQEMAEAYGIKARGVPTTFIGNLNPIVGFTESIKSDMESKIENCLEHGCINPASKL